MKGKKKKLPTTRKKAVQKGQLPSAEVVMQSQSAVPGSMTTVTVDYLAAPPAGKPGKSIHPRRKTPPVPEGNDVPDDAPSPPVDL
jgi:hypothetical protein